MEAIPFLLVVLGLVWLSRRENFIGRLLRAVGRILLWFVLAWAILLVAVLAALALRQASLVGWLVIGSIAVLVTVGVIVRRRTAVRAPEQVERIDRMAFVAVYTVYALAATAWLLLGLLPALAAAFPALKEQLNDWGLAHSGVAADMALQAARSARNSSSGVQVTLDYLFSTLNLALATFLVVKVRGNRTANLLAIGMVGTAVAFNLQSHAALIVIGDHLGPVTTLWHDLGVHVLAGIAYVFALLLFPAGEVDRSRGPHLIALAFVFGLISFFAIADHTSALVLLFGVLVPGAALVAQSRQYRDAQSPELRQLFHLLRVAMGLSLAGALAVLTVTSMLNARDEQFSETTRDEELVIPEAGTYFFYCDPHTDGMSGIVKVTEPTEDVDDTAVVSITARNSKFDKTELEMVAGQTTVIRFTNTDGTAHNVSVYGDQGRRDEIMGGELFSGQDLATFTFRVFRFVFAIIPVALFVAILRFHLWDVDKLVNRAMVYSALTGVLGVMYAAGALIVGRVPGELFNVGELFVVWTLGAGFLFRPLRRRLQSTIDRRFYREKLDAIRTLESFAVHVRDQVDLDELADELVAVVSKTMHPEQVSLWIRDAEGTPGRDVPVGEPR